MKKQINVRFPKSVNLIEWSNYDDLTCFTSLDFKLLNLALSKAAPAPPEAISHGPPGKSHRGSPPGTLQALHSTPALLL